MNIFDPIQFIYLKNRVVDFENNLCLFFAQIISKHFFWKKIIKNENKLTRDYKSCFLRLKINKKFDIGPFLFKKVTMISKLAKINISVFSNKKITAIWLSYA